MQNAHSSAPCLLRCTWANRAVSIWDIAIVMAEGKEKIKSSANVQTEAEVRDYFSQEGGRNVAELVLDVLAFACSSLWEVQLLYTVFLPRFSVFP